MTARTLRGVHLGAMFLLPALAALPLSAHAQAAASSAWGTYLGGGADDNIRAVAQSPYNGDVVVVGGTTSQNFPPRTGTGTLTKQDAFVHIFHASGGDGGGRLLGSATAEDVANSVAINSDGIIFVAGQTETSSFSEFPAAAYPYGGGGGDAFLASYDLDGTPRWLLYLGGSGFDTATSITVSGTDVYVTGYTSSPTFKGIATPGLGSADGFMVKVDASVSPPQVGVPSFFGGNFGDVPLSIALDGAGSVLIAGYTDSTTLPSSLSSSHGGRDGMVAKLNASTGSLSWITYLGGTGLDEARGILPLPNGLVVVGVSDQGATKKDIFVTRLRGTGQEMGTGTFGGAGDEEVWGITTDISGNLYIGGSTSSRDFPTKRPFDPTIEPAPNPDPQDGFVLMLPAAGSRQLLGWSSFVGGPNHDAVQGLSMGFGNRLVLAGQTFSGTELFSSSPYDGTLDTPPDGFIKALDLVDITPPQGGSVYDRPQEDLTNTDISTTTSTTSLSANWDPFTDSNSSVDEYECAFGTAPGSEDVSPFTPNTPPLKLSCTAQSLTLSPGQTYFATVRATNSMGITAVISSDGVTVPGTPPADGGTDGGTSGTDGGTSGTDGGTSGTDGGTDEMPIIDDQPLLGFACTAADAGLPMLVGLLALALLARRRGSASR